VYSVVNVGCGAFVHGVNINFHNNNQGVILTFGLWRYGCAKDFIHWKPASVRRVNASEIERTSSWLHNNFDILLNAT